MRLNSRDFIVFFTKQHVEFIMSEEKTIRNEIDKKRVKIYAIYERAEIIIVAESMTYL